MHFQIITLYPLFFNYFFKTGLMHRAVREARLKYTILNLKKYGLGKHKKIDGAPFGGGGGMLIKKEVLAKSLKSQPSGWVVLLSPRGKQLTPALGKKLARKPFITFVCGHYEGVDQRFIDEEVDEEISLGDYVLFQGESAAMVVMEVVVRYLDGFLGNEKSALEDSFENGLLEQDQYTRPNDERVPQVLVGGHHRKIEIWRRNNQIFNTLFRRPKMFKEATLLMEEECEFKRYLYLLAKERES